MPQFYIVLQPSATDFGVDHPLHATQTFYRAEVHIAPIDEWAQQRRQLGGLLRVACHGPRLDHGIALPIPPLVLIIALKRSETVHQGAAFTVRTQTHIHPKHKTLGSNLIEGTDHSTPYLGKEFLIADRVFFTVGLTGLWVNKYQINIGGDIKLLCPELAHGQHNQLLGLTTVSSYGHTVPVLQRGLRNSQGLCDSRLGQQ